MRERGQASVEAIALTAATLALAIALGVGAVRFGPAFAATVARALSVAIAPGSPEAPALDDLERALLAAATAPAADGPTLLDLRTRLRARLGRPAADAAFARVLRPLVARALEARSITSNVEAIAVVDRATEDTWIRGRFHPGLARRVGETAAGLAGIAGGIWSLAVDVGITADEPEDGIEAGSGAGDVVVQVSGGGYRNVVLRRRPGKGLAVVSTVLVGGKPMYAPSADAADPGGTERRADAGAGDPQ